MAEQILYLLIFRLVELVREGSLLPMILADAIAHVSHLHRHHGLHVAHHVFVDVLSVPTVETTLALECKAVSAHLADFAANGFASLRHDFLVSIIRIRRRHDSLMNDLSVVSHLTGYDFILLWILSLI